MARARGEGRQVDIWPGFVDALSTLLMAFIFLLVVFVLAQFLMGRLLEGRNEAMVQLESQVGSLTTELEAERDVAANLRSSLSRLNADLAVLTGEREDLRAELSRGEAERDDMTQRLALADDQQRQLQRTLDAMRLDRDEQQRQATSLRTDLEEAQQKVAADRETIELQLAQLVQLRRDIEALGEVRRQLEVDVASRLAELERVRDEGAAAQAALEAQLDARTGELERSQEEMAAARVAFEAEVARRLAEIEQARAERAALERELGVARDGSKALEARLATVEERTLLAQREIEARDLRIEDLTRQSANLQGQRDQAVAGAEDLARQIAQLSDQLRRLDAALDLKQQEIDAQSETIDDLGRRLNVALARRVQELSQFRSDFFGRVRQMLGEREDVRVVGDRFVFQSEVLFASGEAELNEQGRRELARLAETLKEITEQMPTDLPWVLQVDGHTDRRPIATARFPSNWELSTARAISVARFLIEQGIPNDRVAATGFAEFQPLDPSSSEASFRRNRRIEIKVTTR
jgi:chemotaxis protein MotB